MLNEWGLLKEASAYLIPRLFGVASNGCLSIVHEFNPHERSFPPAFEFLQSSASSFAFGPMLSDFSVGIRIFRASACRL